MLSLSKYLANFSSSHFSSKYLGDGTSLKPPLFYTPGTHVLNFTVPCSCPVPCTRLAPSPGRCTRSVLCPHSDPKQTTFTFILFVGIF